jgi:hypothetical protein
MMKYPDEAAGIGWHNHNEDFGCDTPVLLIATGAERDFYLGEINKTKPKAPTKFWKRPAEHGSLIVLPDSFNYTHWHAILTNTGENRKNYGVPNISYGPRISINTKCCRNPCVFSIKSRHPRWAVYVGCKYGHCEGTIYGNSYRPFDVDGHYKSPVAHTEAEFREYAEKKWLDPEFRAQAIKDLRGKHLLCWCIQDGLNRAPFCHARVWREIVNRP